MKRWAIVLALILVGASGCSDVETPEISREVETPETIGGPDGVTVEELMKWENEHQIWFLMGVLEAMMSIGGDCGTAEGFKSVDHLATGLEQWHLADPGRKWAVFDATAWELRRAGCFFHEETVQQMALAIQGLNAVDPPSIRDRKLPRDE